MSDPDAAPNPGTPQPTVVVRFRHPGDWQQMLSGDLELARHEEVIVETAHGPELATVLLGTEVNSVADGLPRVLRRPNEHDRRAISRRLQREQEALVLCKQLARKLGHDMHFASVEFTHTGSRGSFYFTSKERVDFRALVKDLAKRFRTRVEMRQVGVRDAAKHTGGIGICGTELCCSRWLPTFAPISIRMAKDQRLSLNHEKLSGLCGRLRCCLKYEQETYRESQRGMPKVGKEVITPDGPGKVRDLDILQRQVVVRLASGEQHTYGADDVARPPNAQQARKPPQDRDTEQKVQAGDHEPNETGGTTQQ